MMKSSFMKIVFDAWAILAYLQPRQGMNDTVAKHRVRLVPPFDKGGLGGILGCHDSITIKQNPPQPPFRKGGR